MSSSQQSLSPLWDRRDEGAVVVVTLRVGWILGPEVVQPIREALIDLIEREGRHRLVLDFTAVEFFESLFLAVLFGLVRRLHPVGGRLALAGLRPSVAAIFEPLPTAGIGWMRFFPTAAEAVPWCASDAADASWTIPSRSVL
jgi:anti-anti-sigma factor